MLLSDYIDRVRDLLHDPFGNFYSTTNLTKWVNRARKQVAKKGECVRILPPGQGSISSIAVNSGGSGYTTAAVAISAPDAVGMTTVQATATATILAGAVTGITVTNAGSGYVAQPTVTITGTGAGALATAVVTAHLTTVADQEVYQIATVSSIINTLYPGSGNVLGVRAISVSWGALKPTLRWMDFSSLQAYLRGSYVAAQNYPMVWSQYGQGVTGSIYLFPRPAMVTAMEWDCYCSVADLSVSQTVDLIPEPWDEAVVYYAGYLSYMNAQRADDARNMLAEHDRMMLEARAAVTPAMVPSFYGEG